MLDECFQATDSIEFDPTGEAKPTVQRVGEGSHCMPPTVGTLGNTLQELQPAAGDTDDSSIFELDITFIENTPQADGILFCATSDGCGASCPSACTTSIG